MDEREQLCGDLDELLEVYGDMVYRVALQNMGNIADAQDVAQDVFLRILKKKPQFTSTTHERHGYYGLLLTFARITGNTSGFAKRWSCRKIWPK